MIVLLALDPSSTKTGYAIMAGRLSLLEGGVLRAANDNALDRAFAMAADLPDLVREHGVTHAIVETPARQAPRGKSGAQGQATYGAAVGIILAHTRLLLPGRVETSGADQWTNRVSKDHRQRCVAFDFPAYRIADDKGGDCSDAVALGQWWFVERAKRGVA